jgi:hypothetical protein
MCIGSSKRILCALVSSNFFSQTLCRLLDDAL